MALFNNALTPPHNIIGGALALSVSGAPLGFLLYFFSKVVMIEEKFQRRKEMGYDIEVRTELSSGTLEKIIKLIHQIDDFVPKEIQKKYYLTEFKFSSNEIYFLKELMEEINDREMFYDKNPEVYADLLKEREIKTPLSQDDLDFFNSIYPRQAGPKNISKQKKIKKKKTK